MDGFSKKNPRQAHPTRPDYIAARTVEEFVYQTNISDRELLDRVLLPGHELGDYQILGFIAAGGMGEVYAAKRRGPGHAKSAPIALKVINPEYADDWRIVERFKREASISKAIRSPNVIKVYEYRETADKKAYIAMELLRGEELFERLSKIRTLPLDKLADLALQVLRGLGDIHRSGFIHRDIKPENIFMARQIGGHEVAKILDFGIAKRRDERSDPLLSVAGQIYGTPEYLAPEQANHPDVDPRADIYSVGVMLYEAAAGSLPFIGDTSYSVIAAHQNESINPLPSTIDPLFAEIVYTALAKDPRDRFQSADEMAVAIEKWQDETSWVEELPGEDIFAFSDVFDSQDFRAAPASAARGQTMIDKPVKSDQRAPRRARKARKERSKRGRLAEPEFILDDQPLSGAASGAPAEFEKLSETKARERRARQKQQAARTKLAVERTGEFEKPGRARPSAAGPAAPAEHSSRGAQIAHIVTWVAVIVIVLALAWAFS